MMAALPVKGLDTAFELQVFSFLWLLTLQFLTEGTKSLFENMEWIMTENNESVK